jgi:hypothetical protein
MGFVSKKSSGRFRSSGDLNRLPVLFLVIITMAAIAVFVQYDRLNSGPKDLRAKAYIQAATGIRIEGEEMTLSGSVTKDPTGSYLQF